MLSTPTTTACRNSTLASSRRRCSAVTPHRGRPVALMSENRETMPCGAYTGGMNLTPSVCYRAVQARDARYDGRFFTCVKTTGIYCRPICPARPPKLENCVFVPTAAAAQEAGFRPCLLPAREFAGSRRLARHVGHGVRRSS